jgi:hypothetical protein
MYELHLFQGNWDGSSVIPDFKPRELKGKKKWKYKKLKYQNPTRPLSVGRLDGIAAAA